MFRISEQITREIRDRVSIVELVGHYIQLKKAGRSYKGVCPFHSDSAPSFHVSDERQFFHCFGCHAHGDVITFLMRIENLSFVEAVEQLAERCGVDIPKSEVPEAEREKLTERDRILDVNARAAAFYENTLWHEKFGKVGREYLEKRGISAETARAFRLGLAQDAWDTLFKKFNEKNFSAHLLEKAGLLVENKRGSYYDRFRNRLMFPIIMQNNQIVGFGGRALNPDDEAKYMNSPESEAFHKSSALYGYHLARQAVFACGEVIVVEGNIDVIRMHQAGFSNTVATLGTALTEQHIRMLKRAAKKITMLFDGDKAGRAAMFRSLELFLQNDVNARAVMLPDGHDPDSYLGAHTADEMQALLEKSSYLLDLWLEEQYPAQSSDPRARAEAAAKIIPMLRQIASGVERAIYIQRVATRLGVPEDSLLQMLRQHIARFNFDRPSSEKPETVGSEPKTVRQKLEETILILALFYYDSVSGYMLQDGLSEIIENPLIRNFIAEFFDIRKDGLNVKIEEYIQRLEDGELKSSLAAYLLDGAPFSESDALKTYNECKTSLKRLALSDRISDLRRSLAGAGGREPDDNEKIILMQEKLELERELQKLKASA